MLAIATRSGADAPPADSVGSAARTEATSARWAMLIGTPCGSPPQPAKRRAAGSSSPPTARVSRFRKRMDYLRRRPCKEAAGAAWDREPTPLERELLSLRRQLSSSVHRGIDEGRRWAPLTGGVL